MEERRRRTSSNAEDARVILDGRSEKGIVARVIPFLGPAFVASVAYMDPGNFATNIQGGAKFGMGPEGKDDFECGGLLEFPGSPFCVSATNVN